MNGTDTITITTFWLDWLLLPIMIGAGWLTLRWALADWRKASNLEAGRAALPAWAVSVPLFISAAGWVLLGLASLIREEYWEHRVWCGMLILWTLCCLIGAGLILLIFLRGGKRFGVAGILNLVGLVLIALMLCLPVLIDLSSPARAIRFEPVWTGLMAISAGCLMAGMLLGFPYNFPRFPLGIGALFFFGTGALEIQFHKPTFPWLIRLWMLNLGPEFHDAFPESAIWPIVGWVKLLVGIGVAAVLIKVSLSRQQSPTVQ